MMTQRYTESRATVVFEKGISNECEMCGRQQDTYSGYVVTGDVGRDGVAVYCVRCADNYAAESDHHTYLGAVTPE